MSVPRSTRAAVAAAIRAVTRDLSLPPPKIRWFRGARPYWNDDDAALNALSSSIRSGLHGATVATVDPPVIWLRATLRPAVAALLAAHEARHVWQERTLPEDDRRRWHMPTSEQDADDYAWQGALPPALKARAQVALAGKPMGRRFGL